MRVVIDHLDFPILYDYGKSKYVYVLPCENNNAKIIPSLNKEIKGVIAYYSDILELDSPNVITLDENNEIVNIVKRKNIPMGRKILARD